MRRRGGRTRSLTRTLLTHSFSFFLMNDFDGKGRENSRAFARKKKRTDFVEWQQQYPRDETDERKGGGERGVCVCVCVCVYTNTGLVKKCKRNKILKRSERRRDSSGGRDAKAFVVYCSNMPFTLTIPFSHKFKSLRNLSISSASPSTMTSVVTSLSTIFTFTFSFRPALSK